MVDPQTALSLILQNSAKLVSEAELLAKLGQGRPLRVKYGADPSAPDLHLGHAVVLRKLRQLQDLGHSVQFLIGDFTGLIGDPTGRSATRPPLTPEQVQTNARTYQEQVFKVLREDRTEIVFNSRWCAGMTFADVIRLASRYTVARILERDDFEKRYQEGRPIGLHELLYPLIQGYDSVVLKADLELCGTDQIFNCLVARALQVESGQEPEVILALPLLEGLDGVQKMSKSLGNTVGLTDPPQDMFGKLMSVPDALMLKYFTLLTDLAPADLERLRGDLAEGRVHPRAAKADLAKRIVAQYHGTDAATAASAEFDRIFRDRDLPAEMPIYRLDPAELKDGRIWIIKLLYLSGLVKSKAEAQRMVKQGAVEWDQERLTENTHDVTVAPQGSVLQVGKRKFIKIVLAD